MRTVHKVKSCAICGETFKPIHTAQKFCDGCKSDAGVMRDWRKKFTKKYYKKHHIKKIREGICIACGNKIEVLDQSGMVREFCDEICALRTWIETDNRSINQTVVKKADRFLSNHGYTNFKSRVDEYIYLKIEEYQEKGYFD